MKTAKEYSDTAKREVSVDVDALLAAINEISESEVHRSLEDEDPERVSVDGREYHTWHELAEAFELDIHDFSVTEVNR
ncbi:YodD family peroxide/acid resistance protein [Salmonella enterica]|nr:YodD family peroxide/acid resistance protein [Salmonella enterica]